MSDEERRKVEKPDRLTASEIRQVLFECFNVKTGETEVKELDSYDDRNYYVRCSGREYVLKVHNGVDSRNLDFIHAQMDALRRLREHGIACPVDVDRETRLQDRFVVRLLEYVPGTLLYDKVREAPSEKDRLELLEGLGKFLASVDQALIGFEESHPAVRRHLVWDLRQFLHVKSSFLKYVVDEDKRELLVDIFSRFEKEEAETLSSLRRSVIQNDANDRNVLVDINSPSKCPFALLDFGDMIETWLVSELAIAIAYIVVGFFTDSDVEDQDDIWLARCVSTARGYCNANPLNPNELAVLYLLAEARLATSAAIGAYSASKDPSNEYLLVHSEPAWRSIRAMKRVGKSQFERALQAALTEDSATMQPQKRPKLTG